MRSRTGVGSRAWIAAAALAMAALPGGAFAQADRVMTYVIGSFSRNPYESLPVLKNLAALEAASPDYSSALGSLAAAIAAWDSKDWPGARERIMDHVEAVAAGRRFTTTDSLILCSAFYSLAELQGRLGASAPAVPASRYPALAFANLGQVAYYLYYPAVARTPPEETRKIAEYGLAVLKDCRRLHQSPAFDYFEAMLLMNSAAGSKLADNLDLWNRANWAITSATTALPDNPDFRLAQAQIQYALDPWRALQAIEIYSKARPQDPTGLLLRGKANYYANSPVLAKANLERYLELVPDSPERPAIEDLLRALD